MADADLVLRLLIAERNRIDRGIDNTAAAWDGQPGYRFDRGGWLSEQRLNLAYANAAIARRLLGSPAVPRRRFAGVGQ